MYKRFSPVFWALVTILLIAGYAVYANHYAITDWWYLRTYTPSAQVAQLASQATLTPKGRELFYRANPQIVSQRSQMVQHCSISDNQVAELGCYLSSDQIYLLNITEPQLQNEMITTAGYEMLHSAYQRMDSSQRRSVDNQLEQVATTITNPHILNQIQLYAKTEPGARDDELYSVIGTEDPTIPASLTTNYAQYFTNRDQLVAYYQQFNQAFDGLHDQINQLDSQIKATKAQMQAYLAAGEIERYNSLVPGINTTITTYNNDIDEYNRYGQDILGLEPATNSAQ
jgi:hypothetical protein